MVKRAALWLLAGWLAMGLACATAGAAALEVTQLNSSFPDRAVMVAGPEVGRLTPRSVHIIEDGAPVGQVRVTQLTHAHAHDFGVVLVIDVYPQGSAIRRAINAARGLATHRPPEGLLGIVEADARPPVALALTRNGSAISSVLGRPPVISRSGLHVYNATLLGIQMLRQARVAAASVVVISDGIDRGEPGTLRRIDAAAGAAHVRIFTIGIASPVFAAPPLAALAQQNGGRFVEASSARLSQIIDRLESQLSSQYLIRYHSAQGQGQQVAASLHITGIPGTYDISYVSLKGTSAPSRQATAKAGPSVWSSTWAAVALSFVCALLIGLATFALIARRRSLRSRLDGFLTGRSSGDSPGPRTLVQRALGDQRRRRLGGSGRLADLQLELELARIPVSPGRLAAATAAGAVLIGWIAAVLWSSPLAGLFGLLVPVAVLSAIRILADRQRRQFDEQLPDNLQIIASAMRAGHTFGGAIAVVVEDAPEPSRREFRRALADEQFGTPLVDALAQVSGRMQSKEFHHVALVARLQRETGGNTAEVLDIVTDTIRERLDLRRTVRTLSAQGRLTGMIVSALPVVLLIAISLINPHYLRPLFHTVAGVLFLALGLVMMITGMILIRRIVDIEA